MCNTCLACHGHTVTHFCWFCILDGGSFVLIHSKHNRTSHHSFFWTQLPPANRLRGLELFKHFNILICGCAFILENLKCLPQMASYIISIILDSGLLLDMTYHSHSETSTHFSINYLMYSFIHHLPKKKFTESWIMPYVGMQHQISGKFIWEARGKSLPAVFCLMLSSPELLAYVWVGKGWLCIFYFSINKGGSG